MTTTRTPGRAATNTERDAEIYAKYKAGMGTHAMLGAEYGLSAIRVSQIIATHKAREELAKRQAV